MTQPNGNEPALPIPDDTAASPMLGGDRRITYKNVRRLLLERAGGKCERCGVEAGAIGARDRYGEWHDENSIHGMNSDCGYSYFGYEFPDMVKIVLICTRLENEDISNQGLGNLAIYCQRCHLNERREPNMAKARETRRRKRLEAIAQKAAAVGQEVMEL